MILAMQTKPDALHMQEDTFLFRETTLSHILPLFVADRLQARLVALPGFLG